MFGRSKKVAPTSGTLLYLVSVGLIGAAAIFAFSVASVSLLNIPNESFAGCCRSDNVFQYTRGNATAVPDQSGSQILDAAKIFPTFPARRSSTSEPTAATEAEPGPRNTKNELMEGSGSEEVTERRPIAGEIGASADTANMTSHIRDTKRDEQPPSIAVQHHQLIEHPEDDVGSDAKRPVQKFSNRSVIPQLLGADAAFRYRVQKECGPIIFPKLYRHCVASFGRHY